MEWFLELSYRYKELFINFVEIHRTHDSYSTCIDARHSKRQKNENHTETKKNETNSSILCINDVVAQNSFFLFTWYCVEWGWGCNNCFCFEMKQKILLTFFLWKSTAVIKQMKRNIFWLFILAIDKKVKSKLWFWEKKVVIHLTFMLLIKQILVLLFIFHIYIF